MSAPAASPGAHLLTQGGGVGGSGLSDAPTVFVQSTGLPAPEPLSPPPKFQLPRAGVPAASLETMTVADTVNAQ